MAWLELHQSASRHPKILALAKAMGWHRREALGTMADLWLWALDYAPDGHLGVHGAVVIAAALELSEDAETFWNELHAARLVDEDDRIHDWEDYAGRLLVMREGNRRRMREAYKKSARRLRKDCKKSATLPTNQPDQPDTTGPDRTLPPPSPSEPGLETLCQQAAMQLWGPNPSRVREEINRALAAGVSVGDIAQAIAANRGQPAWKVLDPMKPKPTTASQGTKRDIGMTYQQLKALETKLRANGQ